MDHNQDLSTTSATDEEVERGHAWFDVVEHGEALFDVISTLVKDGAGAMSELWTEVRPYTSARTIDSHVRTACLKTFRVPV
jgi:hypothetical protein